MAGTGNWSDDTNHWATTSGGLPGAGNKPTASDNAIFDALSNTTAYTVTIDSAAVCLDLNFSAAPSVSGTITWAGSSTLAISGSLTCLSGMTRTYSGSITFNATSSKTLTFNSVTLANATTFNGASGTWTVQDTWNNSSSNITLTQGTLDTNGKTVTCGTFNISGTITRTCTFGGSAINCATWTATTTTNLTFNANTSTITMSGLGNFNGGALTYNNVTLSATSSSQTGPTILGANTFAGLTRTGGSTVNQSLVIGANQTVTGTITLTGASAINRVWVYSDTLGTVRTLTAAVVTMSNCDFREITGAGAGSWSGTSIGDSGGNSGITFTTPVTRYKLSGNNTYSSTSAWSTSSGGGSGASVPLCQDTIVIDASSFGASATFTIDMLRIPGIDFTNATNTPNITMSPGAGITQLVLGGLNLTSTGTYTQTAGPLSFGGRSAYTLTSAGKSMGAGGINLSAPSGTLTLQDNLTVITTGLSITAGTFDFNDFAFTGVSFSSVGSLTRVVSLGNGTLSLSGTGTAWNVASTGLTLNGEGSTVKFTDSGATGITFAGGGMVYNNIYFNGGSTSKTYTITGTNTFNDIKDDGTAAHTIVWPNVTTSISSWSISGNSGALISLTRTGGSGTWTVSKSSGVVSADYLSISNSTATGGATFYAGANSTDGGGNTGWIFTAPPSVRGGTMMMMGL